MKEIFAAQRKIWDTQHSERRSEHKDISSTPNKFAKKCLKYIANNARILELGAASGSRDARFFARKKNCKIFALDFSLTALSHLREDSLEDGSADLVEPLNADIKHIPLLRKDSLDVVYSRSSLHVSDSDLEELLRHILDMLKIGGYLMIEGKDLSDPKIQRSENVTNNLAVDSDGHLRRIWTREYIMEHIIRKFNLELIELDMSSGDQVDKNGRYINFIAKKNGIK